MTIKFANNVSTTLANSALVGQTTMEVASVAGFPTLILGDYFYGTLTNNLGAIEIVEVTSIAGNVLTCVRGAEGTAPQDWATGATFEIRVTAAGLTKVMDTTEVVEEVQTATSGQTVFTLTTFMYAPGENTLSVYLDGVNQIVGLSYEETSPSVVTFADPLHLGALVKFTTLQTSGITTPAAVVIYEPAGTGAVPTTVQAKLRESVSVLDFATPLAASASGSLNLIFPVGNYTIGTNTIFPMPVTVMPGALITVSAGIVATFNAGIEAGDYTIFSTSDDFLTNPTAVTSVVIRNCNVKADWFCAKVADIQNILTIPDQTNNLTKAYRAAVGNYAVAEGANWRIQYPDGVLELGHGYYRVDKTFAWGSGIGPYYKVTGFKMLGAGVNASYLIRTDMAALDYVLFGAFFTGELTVCHGFKISAYNPSGVTDAQKYSSAARAMAFFQGDSLQLSEIWCSGGQTYITDTNGILRNGVGVQFSSCIDVYFNNLFVENCVTGVAFASSIVSGNNLELYTTAGQAIGLGSFIADWPDTQNTSSTVHITGMQARGCAINGITTIEAGNNGTFQMTDFLLEGYNSEFAITVGNVGVNMITGTSITGAMTQGAINSFKDSTFKLNGTAALGYATGQFSIRDVYASGQTYGGDAGFIRADATAYVNVLTDGVSLNGWSGLLLQAPSNGNIRMLNTSLSAYIGQNDGSTNRQIFIAQGSNCSIQLTGITRNNSDPVALNQFGYAIGGNIFIDVDNLYNATRVVFGGATVKMPSKVAFV